MQFSSETIGEVLVVTLGESSLTATIVNEFKRELGTLLADGSKAVLDLSHVAFMDSSALGALLECLRRANSVGGDLKLCGLTPSVRQVLELVRFNRVFDIRQTRQQALDAFNPAE